jgi:DNA-binding MarR family transcriptional regulator
MHLFYQAGYARREAMQEKIDPSPTLEPDLEPASCNCLAVRQAARQVTQFYDRFMAQTGLRASQYSILARLSRLGPLSINELAALMVMDRTTTGRAVRPLERDKLVVSGPGSDGRTRVVQLTPSGKARLKAASSRWREAQRQFETAYGVAEAAELRSALARAVAAV